MPANRQPKRNKRYEKQDRIFEEKNRSEPGFDSCRNRQRGEEINACTIPNDQREADLICFYRSILNSKIPIGFQVAQSEQ